MVPMVVLTTVQNSVPAADIGAASAVVTFSRSIGAAFGVAVFGTLLNTGFADRVRDLPTADGFDAARPDTIGHLPGALRDTALDAFAHATAVGYLWIAPALAVGTLLALCLKPSGRKPSRRKPSGRNDDTAFGAPDEAAGVPTTKENTPAA
ncbi:DSBA oxidoreductase (Fragment) OS=Streptomyces viridochromogenes OX=1938 GN=ACM01_18210 PE=4 SV=1 [Streptomyces viridochromogenes]